MADSAVLHATQELLEGPTGTPMSYWQLVRWRLRRDKVTLTAAAGHPGYCPFGYPGTVSRSA